MIFMVSISYIMVARTSVAMALKKYLKREEINIKEFATRYSKNFGIKPVSLERYTINWLEKRKFSELGDNGRLEPFTENELNKMQGLLRILKVPDQDPIIQSIRRASPVFKYKLKIIGLEDIFATSLKHAQDILKANEGYIY